MANVPTQYVTEPARRIPVIEEVDVVVIGGGPGGVPAAIQAARQGASVLLVEGYGFLGGLASAGMIGPLFGYNTAQLNERMLDGIPMEVILQLQALGGAPQMPDVDWKGIPFEPEMMKHALERLALEAGVRLLYHTLAADVIMSTDETGHRKIDCLLIENKSGRSAIRAKLYIDATGDGDVAYRAGCAYTKGRPADGNTQAMGTKFRIGGCEPHTPKERARSIEIFKEGMRDKSFVGYHPFAGEVSEYGATVRPREGTPTVTRMKGDGTDARDLTKAEIKFRADSLSIVDFCRERIPGFKDSYLIATPAQVGVRETRQITGHYVLTGNEALAATKFEDGVARSSWFLDIHCPLGLSSTESWCCDKNCQVQPDCHMKVKYRDQLYDTLFLEDGTWYEIPYRSLVARDVANLLISGRCISADHGAMSSLRVMGTCMAIGQAAGCAAGLAIERDCAPAELPGTDVRQALIDMGVPLEH